MNSQSQEFGLRQTALHHGSNLQAAYSKASNAAKVLSAETADRADNVPACAAKPLVVAIDGPAGSGKSSVAKAAASELKFGILDTGAAYRALAYTMLQQGADLDDPVIALAALKNLCLRLPLQPGVPLYCGGVDVSAAIRSPEISPNVSRVAKHPEVRAELNKLFRETVAQSGLSGVVIEGRDITTVVFPDAQVRLILTASRQVRAVRRHKELGALTFEEVLADLAARDEKDLRVVDFINPAAGVTLIDTSDLDFARAVAAVIAEVTKVCQVD